MPKQQRLPRSESKFHNAYTLGESIGSGTFASVKHCKRISDGQPFAVKIISKTQLTHKELMGLRSEIRILQSLRFPHIIQMTDVYDDGTKVRMVLELCQGGDLFDKLLREPNRHFDEAQSAHIVCILACSLKFLHSHFIVHRDLKPENILFTTNGTLKITDFGLAHYLKLPPSLHVMHTCCGTPHYVAPEVLSGNAYSYKIDYWSLGVILYIMLSGFQPFKSNSVYEMYGMVVKGQYTFAGAHWKHVSEDAKDLVRKLMCVDVDQRYEAQQIIQHPFITNNIDLNTFKQNEMRLKSIQLNPVPKSVTVIKTNDANHDNRATVISYNKVLFISLLFLVSALNRRRLYNVYCKDIKRLMRKCYLTFLSYTMK